MKWCGSSIFLPCQAEVESILRAVPRGKAAGLDNISGEVLNAGFSPLAPILHALFTKGYPVGQTAYAVSWGRPV